jgi:hypothetical protein
MARKIIINCMMLGLLISTQSAIGASYDYERAYGYSGRDSGYRDAVDMDDWLEQGRAALMESPVFPDGIRLAGGAEEAAAYEPGLASAIYYFTLPRSAQYLKITIQYRDAAQDDQIAGRLWIKSADGARHDVIDENEDAPLYGDTFVLRSGRSSETMTVPASRHAEDNRVEMHIVAEGRDCIDVRDIRVEYLVARPQFTIVHRPCADYWDRWPRYRYAYHYYYWGPLFWPKTSVVYECWDLPSPFYRITWRPWFFINVVRMHHLAPWWGPRRYTIVYHRDLSAPPGERRHLLRTRLREHQVRVTPIIHTEPVTRATDRPAPTQTTPLQRQEVQTKKAANPPHAVNAGGNQHPTRQPMKEPPVQPDRERATTLSNTQPRTVKGPQKVNNPDPRPADLSSVPPAHVQKDQPQPRAAGSEPHPRPGSMAQGKNIQTPGHIPLNKQAKDRPKTDMEVKPAPIRRPSAEQLNQDKQEPQRQAVNRQSRVQKQPGAQDLSTSATHPERSPHGTAYQIGQQPQNTRAVEGASRARPVSQGPVQTPVQGQSADRQGMGKTVQMQPKAQRETRPHYQQPGQLRPHTEKRKGR